MSYGIYDSQPPCQLKYDSRELAKAVTPHVHLVDQATEALSGGQLIGVNLG